MSARFERAAMGGAMVATRTAFLRELKARKVEALLGAERDAGLDSHAGGVRERRRAERTRALVAVCGMWNDMSLSLSRVSTAWPPRDARKASKEGVGRPWDVGLGGGLANAESGTMGDLQHQPKLTQRSKDGENAGNLRGVGPARAL